MAMFINRSVQVHRMCCLKLEMHPIYVVNSPYCSYCERVLYASIIVLPFFNECRTFFLTIPFLKTYWKLAIRFAKKSY